MTSGSEVALLKQKIAEEYTAARQGLSGLSCGTAQHQFITRRMEAIGQHFLSLEALVGQEEAGRVIAETLEPL